ncbi:(Fe-S)-binding protein [Acetobacterium bakii]|uniref:(Fe-S)-binding protein n=1 Tax=Acetobacterium bakii TaxID=52689 RepID=UPI000682D353|nr:(Fe-S)-binding protein [Acetobacterium bakii]
MSKHEINVFEIYEYLPQNNCKNCGESNCMAFAQKLVEQRKTIGGCAPLREPIYAKNRQALAKIFELNNQK